MGFASTCAPPFAALGRQSAGSVSARRAPEAAGHAPVVRFRATMPDHVIRVGDVEIMALSDGTLEFDLCNFFPTIPEERWRPHEAHLHDHHVRFNLGSYLIRAAGRTILVDTGLGPRPKETPDVPWGTLLKDFQAKGVRVD